VEPGEFFKLVEGRSAKEGWQNPCLCIWRTNLWQFSEKIEKLVPESRLALRYGFCCSPTSEEPRNTMCSNTICSGCFLGKFVEKEECFGWIEFQMTFWGPEKKL